MDSGPGKAANLLEWMAARNVRARRNLKYNVIGPGPPGRDRLAGLAPPPDWARASGSHGMHRPFLLRHFNWLTQSGHGDSELLRYDLASQPRLGRRRDPG